MKMLALTGVLALALVATAEARPPRPSSSTGSSTATAATARKAALLRDTARGWEVLIGLPKAWTHSMPGTPRNLAFWRSRTRAVSRVAARPPHKDGWLCIHRFEGSWSDSGDPYWGGLQMDRTFMRSYAPLALLRRGYADSWTPLEQMWVAERAHRSGRGYGPWPNTARYCGLL